MLTSRGLHEVQGTVDRCYRVFRDFIVTALKKEEGGHDGDTQSTVDIVSSNKTTAFLKTGDIFTDLYPCGML